MNERIKELFKRAGGKTSVRNLASNPVQVVETHELWDDRIEKFAELIVKECIECADTVGKNNLASGYPNSTAHHVKQKIQQHFGVRE